MTAKGHVGSWEDPGPEKAHWINQETEWQTMGLSQQEHIDISSLIITNRQ